MSGAGRAKLRAVPAPKEPEPGPVFVGGPLYDKWYAEIRQRNWEGVHIASDRRLPFAFAHPQTKASLP